MFKKYRQLIIGIIIGSMLFGGVTFAAGEIKQAVMNSQTINIDGTDYTINSANIEGYNYVKLRDILNMVGSFLINYDSSTKTVQVITSPAYEKYTDEHGLKYIIKDGIKYVDFQDFTPFCYIKRVSFYYSSLQNPDRSLNNQITYYIANDKGIIDEGTTDIIWIDKGPYLYYDFAVKIAEIIENN